MDSNRFDALARRLASGTNRRTVLRALAGGLGGLVAAGRAGAQACRQAGSACVKDANCCSTLCDTANADPRQRNKCICPPGQENCRGACKTPPTDYLSDVLNCGACGNRCPIDQCNRATCVNGVCGLEPDPKRIGKSCDDGNCCTINDVCLPNGVCQGAPITCRPPEACEEPDTGICNPTTCQCDFTLRPPDYVCRPTAGDCDVAEHCTGASPFCPPDAFLSNTTECRAAAGGCDAPEHCPGDGPHCPPDGLRPAGFVCRAAADACDVEESCDGVSLACPPDQLKAAGVPCREAAGDCDLPAVCTGQAAACPPNQFKEEGVECRAAVGTCELPALCTGAAAECPPNPVKAQGTICREPTRVCDPAEVCDGMSADCPPDVILERCGPSLVTCCPPGERCGSVSSSERICVSSCGGEGEICCSTLFGARACDDRLVCRNRMCVACGGLDEECCNSGGLCDDGMACIEQPDGSGTCGVCPSQEGEPCCLGECSGGLVCAFIAPQHFECRTSCGGIGDACCAIFPNYCQEGARCLDTSNGRICEACGGVGEHCCPDLNCDIGDCFEEDRCCPGVCDDPTRTYCRHQIPTGGGQDGVCAACGGEGEFCCFYGDRPLCDAGLECLDNSRCGTTCGGLGEPCCRNHLEQGVCDQAPESLVCNGQSHTCVRCGSLGEVCCAGGACDPGIGCCSFGCQGGVAGTCVSTCGGLHEPCCGGPNRCFGDLTCDAAPDDITVITCEPCGALGQPCCFGSQHEQPCEGDFRCRFGGPFVSDLNDCVHADECGGVGDRPCVDRFSVFCDPGLVELGGLCRQP